MNRNWMKGLSSVAACAIASLSLGCGEMTIRTWINIVEEESGGRVIASIDGLIGEVDAKVMRLQGGFLTRVTLNTAQLPGPMNGTIVLEDVRMAGSTNRRAVGKICTWNDPEGESGGTLVIDLLGGTTTSEVFMDAKAVTTSSETFGFPPFDFEEPIDFDIGTGLNIDTFVAAFDAGSPAGLFSSQANFASMLSTQGINSIFELHTVVTNGERPPVFDADLLAFCGPFFAQQGLGDATYYGLNLKSSYMRHNGNDRPLDPLVIDLAEIGASPGDRLNLKSVGTWSTIIAIKDGTDTRLGAVFSRSDEILPSHLLNRIPGAIQTWNRVNTWISIVCIFDDCADWGGDDIGQDFEVKPWGGNMVVPAGAQYLVVAPIDGWRNYSDNTGMGFGIQLEVIE